MKIDILVCYHKASPIFANEILKPILLNANSLNKQTFLKMQNLCKKANTSLLLDNQGENISNLNKHFCELSAIYYAWQNMLDSTNLQNQLIGLFHYRRVLDFSGKVRRKNKKDVNTIKINPKNIIKKFNLTRQGLLKAMENKPILLPAGLYNPKNNIDSAYLTQYEIYARDHRKRDLDIVLEIIKSNFPQFVESSDFVFFTRGLKISWCNMFVMRADFFKEYCEFLFSVLFELHKRIDLKAYDSIQTRIYGYLSERLFNVYIRYLSLEQGITYSFRHHFELKERYFKIFKKPLFGESK